MNKFFIFLALIASPAYAQQVEEINYYARDFPQWAERDKGSAIEQAYNNSIKSSDAYAKVLAKRKTTEPVIRVEGTIIVRIQVNDNRYRNRCPYNDCR